MTKITAAEVNKLRKTTGAGMMDCKKALVEANGDFELAIEILRKKGQKVAAKRADRESTEGAAIAVVNEDKTEGAVIVLGCETDFVGKNESFVNLAKELAQKALQSASKEELLNADFGGITVAEKLIEQTGVIGEKIELAAFEKISAPYVGSYIHSGKIATIVGLSAKVDGVEEVAKDVAMQAAAMNPIALNEEGVEQDVIEKEIPGIGEAMRAESLKKGRTAMLSRGTAGIKGTTLIMNLPGSVTGVQENLNIVLPLLEHMVEKMGSMATS